MPVLAHLCIAVVAVVTTVTTTTTTTVHHAVSVVVLSSIPPPPCVAPIDRDHRLSITGLVEVQNLNRTSVFIVFPALDDLRRETRRLDVLRNVSAQATDHMVPRCVVLHSMSK